MIILITVIVWTAVIPHLMLYLLKLKEIQHQVRY